MQFGCGAHLSFFSVLHGLQSSEKQSLYGNILELLAGWRMLQSLQSSMKGKCAMVESDNMAVKYLCWQ